MKANISRQPDSQTARQPDSQTARQTDRQTKNYAEDILHKICDPVIPHMRGPFPAVWA